MGVENMAKHIIGLILFSLIVGTSVFVAGVSNYSSSVDVAKSYRLISKKKKKRRRRKRRCRPHHRSVTVSVNQVSFNRNSEVLSASFDPSRYGNGVVKLHFFAKDSHGTRFLKTEHMPYAGEGIESFKETSWLSRIDRQQNIYVMAEVSRYPRTWSHQPDFDHGRATPLLISDK